MKNTILNKEKFFALYWGQKVLSDVTNTGERNLYPIVASNFYRIEERDVYLQLKSLQSISDEDAIEVAKIFGIKEDCLFVGKILCNGVFDNSVDCEEDILFNSNAKSVDYLRSKGYLIGYNGLAPDQIISYGWAKI